MRKYLTIDDLILFCKKNNFSHFSAKDAGGPIVVQTPGKFELDGDANTGLLPVKLYACHTNLNRNQSFISKETMEKALPSFSNRPILGYIHQLEDGTFDFYSHNMEVVEDENEEDGARIEYLEIPVGIVPESCNAHLEYDEENQVDRVCVNGFVFEEYTKAADILRAKGISAVSVEVAINDMSYNAKEGYLSIDDMYFMGVTILGRDDDGNIVEPGMAGSNITLGSFSTENNSTINDDVQKSLIDTLSKLNVALDKFNNIASYSNQKGGEKEMDKFAELLELYGLTEVDIDFEHDGLSDEDLEAAFNEHFGSAEEFVKKKGDDDSQPVAADENDDENEDGDDEGQSGGDENPGEETHDNDETGDDSGNESDNGDFKKKKRRCSVNTEAGTVEFELSFDDIRSALYGLISAAEGEDSYSWIIEVYEDYMIYQKDAYTDDRWTSKFYRQSYTKDGDNVSLSGDPVEVFAEFVTESEKTALDMIRTQYEELKAFKDKYDAEMLQTQKDEILNDEKYAVLNGNEQFEQLKKDAKNFSVQDVEIKAKLIFADAVMADGEKLEKKTKKIGFNFAEKSKKAQAYSGLFDK